MCFRCVGRVRKVIHSRGVNFRTKAYDSTRAHARKYVQLGLSPDRVSFIRDFGWDLEIVTKRISQAVGQECPQCGVVLGIHGGHSSITLDVIDTSAPPFFATNVRVLCRSCNAAKGTASAGDWDADESERRAYREWLANGGEERIQDVAKLRLHGAQARLFVEEDAMVGEPRDVVA